ncbi:MAG: 23S rRNA (uridine(2552)-2'-O)-methyltransferase RlmE [Candidatus Dasytiphilus stammeri]
MIKKKSYWLKQHLSDQYVRKAQKMNLRSRAWFKIDEIQKNDQIIKPNMSVIDLGAAPGSWLQYVLRSIGVKGYIIACDILPIMPVQGVCFLQGDFRKKNIRHVLIQKVKGKKIQLIMSDMSPNLSGFASIDIPQVIYLANLALQLCSVTLSYGGNFLVKVFQGEGIDQYMQEVHSRFKKVIVRKPKASRARSREMYIVAKGYKK